MSVMTLCRAIAATVKEEDEADDDEVVTFDLDEGSTDLLDFELVVALPCPSL